MELTKSELDNIISSLCEKGIDWRDVLQNHFGLTDTDKDPPSINPQDYSLVKHSLSELDSCVTDIFYDGVNNWSMMQDYQGDHLVEIAKISQRLRKSNFISVEEKDGILRFLDPELSDGNDRFNFRSFGISKPHPMTAVSQPFRSLANAQ